MGERIFSPSNKRNPCPICGRSQDGDCRISGDLVLCRVGTRHRPPTEKAGTQVTGRDGRQWICRGHANDAGWIQFALAGTSNNRKNVRNNNTRKPPAASPLLFLPNCSAPMAVIAGSVELARLPGPLPAAPPAHLPNDYPLTYGPTQRVTVRRTTDGGKSFPVQHLANNGETATWARGSGPDPWPLWKQEDALQHGRGHWIAEAEGEKCADWLRAGGLVAISQPGHAHKPEQIQPRYLTLKQAGISGIVYLADNDAEGRRRAGLSKQAAAAIGLPFLVLSAGDVWPGIAGLGSIDDAPGTAAERVAAICQAIPAALEKATEDDGEGLLEIAPRLIASGWQYPEKGSPRRTKLEVGDACVLLRESIGPRLGYNMLKMVATFDGAPIREQASDDLYCFLSEHGYTISREPFIDALFSVARQHSFHPVRQYLETIEKDPSLEPGDLNTIAARYLGNTSPLAAAMLRKTLIGAVWRAMEPGCKFDYVTTLKGIQRLGKSLFWKTLASPAWFSDTMPDSHKDFLLNIHSCWFYELAELESVTGKKDVGALKNLITSSTDTFRPPYARRSDDHDRPSIFVGTVNNENFLFDETGNSRFWTVEVVGKPDISGLQTSRDALWKAAMLAYRAGERPVLSDEHAAASEELNKGYVAEDPWEGPISRWAEAPSRAGRPFDTAGVIAGAELRDPKQINSHDARRVAACLKRLGYAQDKNPTWVDGTKSRFWRKQAAEQPKRLNPLAQMAQIGTDEIQTSVPGQTPDAPVDLKPLEQMEQIKYEIGVGIEVGGTGEGGVWRAGESFPTSSVPSPKSGQTPCGSNDFLGTDPLGIDLFQRPPALEKTAVLAPAAAAKGQQATNFQATNFQADPIPLVPTPPGSVPTPGTFDGTPLEQTAVLAPQQLPSADAPLEVAVDSAALQNTPLDVITTKPMDLTNLLPWQELAIQESARGGIPATIRLHPDMPTDISGRKIQEFVEGPEIAALVAQLKQEQGQGQGQQAA